MCHASMGACCHHVNPHDRFRAIHTIKQQNPAQNRLVACNPMLKINGNRCICMAITQTQMLLKACRMMPQNMHIRPYKTKLVKPRSRRNGILYIRLTTNLIRRRELSPPSNLRQRDAQEPIEKQRAPSCRSSYQSSHGPPSLRPRSDA